MDLMRRLGVESGALVSAMGRDYGEYQVYRYGPHCVDPYLTTGAEDQLTHWVEWSRRSDEKDEVLIGSHS